MPTQHVQLVPVGGGIVQLRYRFTGGGRQRVAGLGVRVHYDPTCVRVKGVREVEKSGLVGLDASAQADDNDADGDPRTTRFLQVAWLDLRGAWLGGEMAQRNLLSLEVETLACTRGSSELRVSGTGVAPGVRLETVPLRLGSAGSS